MSTTMNDVYVQEFAEMLSYLEPHPPLTEELDTWGCTYQSEKAHMFWWFASQETNGSESYTRSTPNSSSKITYNRLLAPGAMLWIAEVMGETPERLRAACHAAAEAEKVHWRNRAKGFREVIPFDRIYELYQHPEGWLYDKQIVTLIGRDDKGYPLPLKAEAIRKVLKKELN